MTVSYQKIWHYPDVFGSLAVMAKKAAKQSKDRDYFDLYTTTEQPMNIYSHLFAKRLGFRTPGIARRSVNYINHYYRHFGALGDRPGQHHALVMALTMFDRARWSKKFEEAAIFKDWIVQQLEVEPRVHKLESTTPRVIHRVRQ